MLRIFGSALVRGLLLIAVCFLQIHLWFSESGFSLYQRINGKIRAMETVNQHAVQDNTKLAKAVDDLKQDGKLLRSNAREHLGMIGPDETLFQVAS